MYLPIFFPLPQRERTQVRVLYTTCTQIYALFQLRKLGVTMELFPPLKLTPHPNPSPARGEGKDVKNSKAFA
jgi:hypothetical protein